MAWTFLDIRLATYADPGMSTQVTFFGSTLFKAAKDGQFSRRALAVRAPMDFPSRCVGGGMRLFLREIITEGSRSPTPPSAFTFMPRLRPTMTDPISAK